MKNLRCLLAVVGYALFTFHSNAQSMDYAKTFNVSYLGDSKRTVTIDQDKNVIFWGGFFGSFDVDPGPGTQTITATGSFPTQNNFIAKYDSLGNLLWSQHYNSSAVGINALITDENNFIYAAGRFAGTFDFDRGPGTFNLSSVGGDFDIFLLKLDPNGNFINAKRIVSSNSTDFVYSMIFDQGGRLALSGMHNPNTDFDPGPGTLTLPTPATYASYIAKYTTSGNLVWAKSYGAANTTVNSFNMDYSGNFVINGAYEGSVDIRPGPDTLLFDAGSSFYSAGYLLKIDSAGNFIWAKNIATSFYWSCPGGISHTSIAQDNGIYAVGGYSDTVYINPTDPSDYLFQSSPSSSNYNFFVAKYNSSGDLVWKRTLEYHNYPVIMNITTDRFNLPVISGYFKNTLDADPGPAIFSLSTPTASAIRGVMVRLNPSGDFNTAKMSGGAIESLVTEKNGDHIWISGMYGLDTPDLDPGTSTFLPSASQGFYFSRWYQDTCAYILPVSLNIDSTICAYDSLFFGAGYIHTPGIYTHSFTSVLGCDSTVHLTLSHSTVDSTVSASGYTLTASATSATYQWLDCNTGFSPIAGETNQNFTATANGTYAVIIHQNGCTDTSACYLVTGLGMAPVLGANISIYPNPVTNELNIAFEKAIEANVTLTDITGQMVLSQRFNASNLKLKTSNLNSGIYLLTIEQGSEKTVLKVVKE